MYICIWIPNGSLPCSPIHRHAPVMQNTIIMWLSIVQSELRSVFTDDLIFAGFTLLVFLTLPSTCFLVMQNTTVVWLSIDLICNLSYKVCRNMKLTGCTFSPNSFAIIIFNYTDLKIRVLIMMYLHAWPTAKLISWALSSIPIIMRSSNLPTNMWIDLRSLIIFSKSAYSLPLIWALFFSP